MTYQYIQGQSDTTLGVIRQSDSQHIPPDPYNGDWAEYLEWVDGGGTTQPATAEALVAAQSRGYREVDIGAESALLAHIPMEYQSDSFASGVYFLMIAEAREVFTNAGDETATSHALLQAFVGTSKGASLFAVASTLMGEWDTISSTVGQINKTRVTAREDIEAALSVTAVDAILDALTWPS